MVVRAAVFHGETQTEDLALQYAGRTNVFAAQCRIPAVSTDYEVLSVTVTAAQPATANFGVHQRTFKLKP